MKQCQAPKIPIPEWGEREFIPIKELKEDPALCPNRIFENIVNNVTVGVIAIVLIALSPFLLPLYLLGKFIKFIYEKNAKTNGYKIWEK